MINWQSLLVPGFSGAVPLLLRPPIPPRQLDLSATGGELGEGASSLMAFGREWKARHEYLLRAILMSTWGFLPAVFRPFRTVFCLLYTSPSPRD